LLTLLPKPNPHPALRATLSRRERGTTQSVRRR
jgi:hypothetical protein